MGQEDNMHNEFIKKSAEELHVQLSDSRFMTSEDLAEEPIASELDDKPIVSELKVAEWFLIDRKVIDENIYEIRRECINEGPAGERLWERFEVSNEIANQNPKQYPRVMEVYIFKNDWESVEKECKSVPEMQAMCKQIGDGMCDEIICDLELQMRICNGESVYDLVEKPDKLPYARLIMLRNGWDAFFGGDYVTNRVLMIPPANLDIRRFYPNVKLRFSVPYAFRRKRNESSHRLITSECMDNDKPIVSKPKKNNPNPTKRKRRKRSRRR